MNEQIILEHKQACDEKRKTLSQGPWMTEPDRLNWVHNGLDCMIVRSVHSFSLCGYVGLPPKHPLYGKKYDDCPVEVHGGLTYSDYCSGSICHPTEEGADKTYWLGFDCAHYHDAMPGLGGILPYGGLFDKGVYRDIEYVTREVEMLVNQLAFL